MCPIRLMSVRAFAYNMLFKGQAGRKRLKVSGGKVQRVDNLEI